MGIFSEKLQDAIANKHIKIYYQPVIRTLSKKLCSFEALARWEDPELGILNPKLFIDELEQNEMIHILDCYMIDEICHSYKLRLNEKTAMVPISFNLSRLDFTLCDIFHYIESTIKKYQVPREMFILEITESILETKDSHTRNIINQFHDAGYKVWMDDFGSGYSSLNVLKDYDFDQLKIDMEFLSVFNEKSKKIITSIVEMSKRIGVQSLAEGVETMEQLDFLTEIGCDKAQGYYFGKPMCYTDLMEHCISRNFIPESRPDVKLYDAVSSIHFVTDQSFGILLLKKNHLEWKHLNQNGLEILNMTGSPTIEYSNKKLNSKDSPIYHIYRNMTRQVIASKKKESFSFPVKDSYLKVNIELISSYDEKYLFAVYFNSVNVSSANSVQAYINKYIREALLINDTIQLINIEEDWCETLMHAKTFPENEIPKFYGIQKMIHKMSKYSVYSEDSERFQDFMNLRLLPERLQNSKSGYFSQAFRILNTETGTYEKKLISISLVPDSEEKIFMIMVRDYIDKQFLHNYSESESSSVFSNSSLTYKDIFISLAEQLNFKFFFKDAKRRFTYVSKAFLEHYKISSPEYILGKTDEDMRWHPDSNPFRKDELDVLKHGKCLRSIRGNCIVQGTPHEICATKIPLYHDGEIVGIFGFFYDLNELAGVNSERNAAKFTDSVTSLMNGGGFISSMLQFEEERTLHGTDYTVIMIDIPEYIHILSVYGNETGNHLLRQIADILVQYAGVKGILCRFLNAKFIIATKYLSSDEVIRLVNLITEAIHNIHTIDGYDCTLYAYYGIALGSEINNISQLPALLEKRLKRHLDRNAALKTFSGEKLIFDRDKFDELSDIVYISDIEDYSLIYLNYAGRKMCGLSRDTNLEGMKCYEVLQGFSSPCEFCNNHHLQRNCFYEWTFHNKMFGRTYLLRDTMITSHGKKFRFEIAIDTTPISETKVKNPHTDDIEQFENDCIHIAMRDNNPNIGLRRMIEKIGRTSDANCVHIFETDSNGHFSTTYMWCKDGFTPAITASDVTNIAAISIVNICEPLIFNHKIIGYVIIENPSKEYYSIGKNILNALSQFIVMMIQNRNTLEKLEMQGRTDELTGVLNRRAFAEYKPFLTKQPELILVFCDINGLKRENDNFGHHAGDLLIKNTASVLIHYFGQKNVFRMGGDEFLAFKIPSKDTSCEKIIEDLRSEYAKKDVSVAIGTANSKDFDSNIEEILKIADQRMYEDKQRIYREINKKLI